MSTQQVTDNECNRFVNTGEDKEQGTRLLLDLVTKHLEQKWSEMKTEKVKRLGSGFENSIKPWALVFIKEDNDSLEKVLLDKAVKIFQGHPDAEPRQRVWFDSIQVCRVESTHQLRGVLCALHVNSTTENQESAACKSDAKLSNILDWVINEKENQPPCLIVVVDLVDIIISKMVNHSYSDPHRYLHLPFNVLSLVLVNLLETCEYESTIARSNWEKSLGLEINHSTKLMITDSSCIPPYQALADFNQFQRTYTEKLFKILSYYIDRLV